MGVQGGDALRGRRRVKRTHASAHSWRGSALAPGRDGGSLAAAAAAPVHGGRVRAVWGGGGRRAEGRGGAAGARRKEAGGPGGGARVLGSSEGGAAVVAGVDGSVTMRSGWVGSDEEWRRCSTAAGWHGLALLPLAVEREERREEERRREN
uniref:Uncharacterized protein n=1 Tax=Oryza sativa subsp. japonica TaxID=39947 RepID=Q6YUJ7_ORYSJ|nr:hypothetical protein [Oryza sativa Japonica Group]